MKRIGHYTHSVYSEPRCPHRMAAFAYLVLVGCLLTCGAGLTGCDSRSSDSASSNRSVAPERKHFGVERPNVLLIVIDTLRADHLGCYGYHLDTTPNIDRLATRSVVFDRAFSNSDGTILSHISLFSSRYTHPNELRIGSTTTLAEAFRTAGYATYGVSANPALATASGWGKGFDWYTDRPIDDATLERSVNDLNYSRQIEVRDAEQTTDFVLEALHRHRDERPDHPWFLFVNYLDPHDPYTERRPWSETFRRSDSEISGTLRPTEGRTIWKWIAQSLPALSEADVRRLGELYDAEIGYTDDQIQRVFDFLVETGQANETIILVTSDHGEVLGENGQFTHMLSVMEPEIRVPFVLHVPGLSNVPARSETLVESVDVAPTLLSLAGVTIPDTFQGKILLDDDGTVRPTERSHTLHTHRAVNAPQRRSLNYPKVSATDSIMLRFEGVKLYLMSDGSYEFRDMNDEPLELSGRALRHIVSALRPSSAPSPLGTGELPQQVRDALKTLGYIAEEKENSEATGETNDR